MNYLQGLKESRKAYRDRTVEFLNFYWEKQLHRFLRVNIVCMVYGLIACFILVPNLMQAELQQHGRFVYGYFTAVAIIFEALCLLLLKGKRLKSEVKAQLTGVYSFCAALAYLSWGVIVMDNTIRESETGEASILVLLIIISVFSSFFFFPVNEYILLAFISDMAASVVLMKQPGMNMMWGEAFNSMIFQFFLVVLGASRYVAFLNVYEKEKALKLSNERLMKANLQQKSFTAALNHELRTPLNGIIGILGALQSDGGLSTVQKERVELCEGAGRTMLSIVNDMLDFSRIEAGEGNIVVSAFDLREIVRATSGLFSNLAAVKHIDLNISVAPNTVCELISDEARIQQIINNIVSNSVKYTASGHIDISFSAEDAKLVIIVADTGQGISKENLEVLFEPYKRFNESENRKIHGTGLGMAIVDRLIKQLGGSIEVESEVGKGSCFTITIPVIYGNMFNVWREEDTLNYIDKLVNTANGATNSVQGAAEDTLSKGGRNMTGLQGKVTEAEQKTGKKILCVDDTKLNLIVLENLMADCEVELITTTNPHEALQMAQTDRFDLLMLDHQMPEMDGLELLNRIKTTKTPNSATPAIMLTGNSREDSEDYYYELGFAGYLVKPVDKKLLLEILSRYLN